MTYTKKYNKDLIDRRNEFPDNWQEYRYAKSDAFNKTIQDCIRWYRHPFNMSLDSIAEKVGLKDRRYVASYLNKAKKVIKSNENAPRTD